MDREPSVAEPGVVGQNKKKSYIEDVCVNLTPHNIVIRKPAGDIVLPPSGTIARLDVVDRPEGSIGGVEIVSTSIRGIVGLPVSAETVEILDDQGTPQMVPMIRTRTYIVSSMVLEKYDGPLRLLAPDTGPTAIRENGQIVAVTRLRARDWRVDA